MILAAIFNPASSISASPLAFELQPYEPAADPAAAVVVGRARFTVLAPRLLRLEYSETGTFEDRPTLAFVNRKQPVPEFTWSAVAGTSCAVK